MNEVDKMLADICGNDPIRKKWVRDFFLDKAERLNSNLTLDEFCMMMERDEKLEHIISQSNI